MIIIYEDHYSFQRCGNVKEQGREYDYVALDELYTVQLIDDIILERGKMIVKLRDKIL